MSHVFISYVRDDSRRVDELARDLKSAGINVWLDREQLHPGERWRDSIRAAIRSGALFVACFSRASARRERSYMNEELLLAVDELRLRAADRSWFVPVRLDDGEVPPRPVGGGETLHDLQWVDLATNWSVGVDRIIAAAKHAAERAAASDAQPSLPACGISLSAGTIRRGEPVRLNWSSTNAKAVTIAPDVGEVAPSGSINVWPQVTTTYTIAAVSSHDVQAEASATVYVAEPSVTGDRQMLSGSIIATPDTIRPGELTYLKWNSFSATEVTISPDIGVVPLTGAVAVSPRQTTTYTMTLTNSQGGYAKGSATVYVRSPESPTATEPSSAPECGPNAA